MKHTTYILLSLLGIAVLTACGPEDDTASIAGGGRGGDSIGFLTLSITDAPPIVGATEVVVQIDGVTLQHEAEPGPTTITFVDADGDPKPMMIDLLTLQGQVSAPLLENEALKSGNYSSIKLNITAVENGSRDSYIMLDGKEHELDIPSGSESGLKINNQPQIIANTLTKMTMDFDLMKSIKLTGSGKYILNPVLKLVHDELTGSITGTVNSLALTGADCTDDDAMTHNLVYRYDGFKVTPDDYGSLGPPDDFSFVSLNADGDGEYEFGSVPFGQHTVAFTCQADRETEDINGNAINDDIEFSKTVGVKISNTNPKTAPKIAR